jgi:hypothetical protein
MNGKSVSWLRSLHIDRSSLGIEKHGRSQGTARKVIFLRYPALKGIVWVDGHPLIRFHSGYGLSIRIEGLAVGFGYDLGGLNLLGHFYTSLQ